MVNTQWSIDNDNTPSPAYGGYSLLEGDFLECKNVKFCYNGEGLRCLWQGLGDTLPPPRKLGYSLNAGDFLECKNVNFCYNGAGL